MSRENISDITKNTLEELGNIGTGNAATSLSMLLSSELTVTPPEVSLCDFNDLPEKLGGADNTVVGVLSTITGDIDAMILFTLGIGDAKHLVDKIVGNGEGLDSELGTSALQEVANIFTGSYVSSLETLSGLKIRHSLPQLCVDMAGSILSVPCIEFGMVSDRALVIDSHFKNGENEIDGCAMLLAEMHSFNMLLRKLGIGGIDE